MKKWIGLLVILLLLGTLYSASASTLDGGNREALQQTGSVLPPAIITFEVDLSEITVSQAEAGRTSAILSWHTVGMTGAYRLILESYVINTWELLLGPDADPPETSGMLPIIVRHPLNFGPPTYRLSIVDAGGRTIDQRIVMIPYAEEPDADPPKIEVFSTEVESLSTGDLTAGTARVQVSWTVRNRTPTTNLRFEQVLADGSTAVVELPRPNLWVPSSGQGPLAPVLPGGGEDVQLRLQLVDLADGSVLDERMLTVSVSESAPTSPPPVEGSSEESSAAPVVALLSVTPNPVDRGGTVTVNWDVWNALRVHVYRTNPVGQFADFVRDQPPVGSWTVTLPDYHVDSAMFYLEAEGAGGTSASASVSVQVNCPYTYFFGETNAPQECPLDAPQDIPGAFQSFEGGYMLWRGDIGQIYALLNGGTVRRYQDTWVEGDIVAVDATPPSGMYQPERGFGKVWAEDEWLREQLGWATAPEEGYTMRMQSSGAYRYPYTYMTLPDDRVVYVIETQWDFLES